MKTSEYPQAHEVTLVHKPLKLWPKKTEFHQVQTVLVDGQPLCLPRDVPVKVEADAGGAGYQITVTILARSVITEPYEYEAKHLQETT